MSSYDEPECRATLRFLVSAAAELSFPDRPLHGGQTVGSGYMYAFASGAPATAAEVATIGSSVASLVSSDLPIERSELTYSEAMELFTAKGLTLTVALLKSRAASAVVAVNSITTSDGRRVVRLALQ